MLGLAAGVAWLVLRPSAEERWAQRAVSANQAMKMGRFKEAALVYRELLEEQPSEQRVRRNLAVCLFRLGRLEEAEAAAKQVLEADPEIGAMHDLLSRIAAAKGDLKRAIAEARLAMEVGRVPGGARSRLADLLLEAGLRTEALSLLADEVMSEGSGEEEALRLASVLPQREPRTAAEIRAVQALRAVRDRTRRILDSGSGGENALRSYAAISLQLGKVKEAVEVLEAAAGERPLDPAESLLLAQGLVLSGRAGEARAILDGIDSTALPPALAGSHAEAWILLGDPKAAAAVLDPAIEAAPEDLGLLRQRLRVGLIFYGDADVSRRTDPEELLAAAEEVLRRRPVDELALWTRGLALVGLGRAEEAIGLALQLRREAPENPRGGWLHGLALLATGHAESALVLFQHFREGAIGSADRWILQAAVAAGDRETAERLARRFTGPRETALRVGALALADKVDEATALAATPGFASSPAGERVQAASRLVAVGADEEAREILRAVESSEDVSDIQLLLADLALSLGEREHALETLALIAREEGPRGRAALERRAWILATAGSDAGAEVEKILRTLRGMPGGEAPASRIEARIALAGGDREAAADRARAAVSASPDDLRSLDLLLRILRSLDPEYRDELRKVADRILHLSPSDPAARLVRAEALYERAQSELFRGDMLSAGERLDEAIQLVPGPSEALLMRGVLRASKGEFESAEEDARILAESEGGKGAGNYLLGLLRMRQGRREEAVESFRTSLEASPENPATLLAMGLALLGAGRPEEALEIAGKLEPLDADGFRTLRLRAVALAAMGKVDEAVSAIRAREAEGTRALEHRALTGWILFRAGRPEEAAGEFRALLEAEPRLFMARAMLVECLLAGGDVDAATEVAESALADEELRPSGLVLRARIQAARGDGERELADLEEANRLASDSMPVQLLLGEALLARDRVSEARPLLEKVSEALPWNATVRVDLGIMASEDGRVEDAIARYEEALRLDPENLIAANNLAHHLANRPGSDLVLAQELAERAVRLAPRVGATHDTLAAVLKARGDFAGAALAAEEAMRRDPNRFAVFLNAAETLMMAGLEDRAKEVARRAMELAKEEERADARKQLEALGLLPKDD